MSNDYSILPDFGEYIPRSIVERAITSASGTGFVIGLGVDGVLS